jgi:hypothetical protein
LVINTGLCRWSEVERWYKVVRRLFYIYCPCAAPPGNLDADKTIEKELWILARTSWRGRTQFHDLESFFFEIKVARFPGTKNMTVEAISFLQGEHQTHVDLTSFF